MSAEILLQNPAVVEVVRTCRYAPEQYEGRLDDGRWFYFRYRHGLASLGLGATLDEAVGDRSCCVDWDSDSGGSFDTPADAGLCFAALMQLQIQRQVDAAATPEEVR